MVEIRLADLRFSAPEISEFMSRGMGVHNPAGCNGQGAWVGEEVRAF